MMSERPGVTVMDSRDDGTLRSRHATPEVRPHLRDGTGKGEQMTTTNYLSEVSRRRREGKPELTYLDWLYLISARSRNSTSPELATLARTQGGVCGGCGRALTPDEPVIYVRLVTGHRRERVSVGWDFDAGGPVYKIADFPIGKEVPVSPACCADTLSIQDRECGCWRPCDVCGRPTQISGSRTQLRRRWFCSIRCERRYHMRERDQARAEARLKDCEVCGERFEATRQDAAYCSPACRQKAYRRRKAGA
jgi:hypothetical protein